MVKAQQIERDGTQFGAVREFSKEQWERMKDIYGSKLRWKLIQETPEKKSVHEVEYPEVYGKPDFENMTKRMIISEYGLPQEDIKLSRKDLIAKVVNLNSE